MKRKASLLLLFFSLWSCQTEDEKPSLDNKETTTETPEQKNPSEVKAPKKERLERLSEITSAFKSPAPPIEILLTKEDVGLLLRALSTDPPVDQVTWRQALTQGVGVDGADIDQILLNTVREGMRGPRTPLLLNIIEARRQLSKK